MPQQPRLQTYREFWPFYLKQHAKPGTRKWHFFGTSLFMAGCLTLIITRHVSYLPVPLAMLMLPLLGYGPAWVGHFFVERNKPATFTYPVWSLLSDFKMWGLWVSGRLDNELALAGVQGQVKAD